MMSDIRRYIEQVGDSHRKELGQFITHPSVANFMVEWVLKSGQSSIFDPAFGLGAFYSPIADRAGIHFSATEIDPIIIRFWEVEKSRDASFVEIEDYLLNWGKKQKNIVCNPPYMRFQNFLNRETVSGTFQSNLGLRLSGYTNTASAFLLKSLSEMDGTGRLAYIMPLEFLNAGYGSLVKKRLIYGGHLTAIISINCEKDVFPDATTSVGIILYDSMVSTNTVKFYSLYSIDSLSTVLQNSPLSEVDVRELDPKEKWLQYFQELNVSVNTQHTVPLDYYGRFSRGIATGANEFFVLRPSEAKAKKLSPFELTPCITKSSQIKKAVFRPDDYSNLVEDDAPVFLFSVNGSQSEQAQDYIRFGESQGFHHRFLTKHRKPWFKTESRNPSPLLLGVFSRDGYKIILNRSEALNLTCYHGFKPNIYGFKYVEHLFLFFASKVGRSIMSLSMRKYGDSLDKFEPNDLNSASVPNTEYFNQLSLDQVKDAIREIEVTGNVPEFVEGIFEEIKVPTSRSRKRHRISEILR